jgi:hypothetical protein
MFELTEVRVKSIVLWLFIVCVLEWSPSFCQVGVQGSQKAEDLGRNVYGLGLSAGPASGLGISFRDHFPSKISYQIVGGIIRTGGQTSASIGAEFQYDLVRAKSTRLFFGPSTSYFYNGSGSNTFAGPFRIGMGVGGELNVQEAVNISLEGVFVYFSNGDIAPMPQIACHYYFY